MLDQIAGVSCLLSLQADNEPDIYLKQMANRTRATSVKIKNLAAELQRKYVLMDLESQEQYMKFIEDGIIHEEVDRLSGIGIERRR